MHKLGLNFHLSLRFSQFKKHNTKAANDHTVFTKKLQGHNSITKTYGHLT